MGRKPKSEEKILKVLAERGPLTFTEIAKVSGLAKATLSHALHRLAKRGLIQPVIDGGRIKWILRPRAIAYLPIFEEHFSIKDKQLAKLVIIPFEEWGAEEWGVIFGIAKEYFFKVVDEHQDMPPELVKKLEQAKALLLERWDQFKIYLVIALIINLLFSIISLHYFRDDPEALEEFRKTFLPRALKDIERPVKECFIKILESVTGIKFEM